MAPLRMDRERGGYTSDDLVLRRQGRSVSVCAARPFKIGELMLAPLVNSKSCISQVSHNPWALRVKLSLTSAAAEREFWLVGFTVLPALASKTPVAAGGASSANAAQDVGTPLLCQHDWKPNSFPWPFWAVKKVPSVTAEPSNCSLKMASVRRFVTASGVEGDWWGDAATVSTAEFQVPVLTNHVALAAGDELVVKWDSRSVPKPVKRTANRTWINEAKSKQTKTR